MSRTIKQSPKSKVAYSSIHKLPLETVVVLQHTFTDEIIYGMVIGWWSGEDGCGCVLRRTDQYGNQWLSSAMYLDEDDYMIKEVDGVEMF